MLKVYFHILSFPAQVLLLQFTTVCLMLIKGSFYSQKLPFLFHSLSQKVVRSHNLSKTDIYVELDLVTMMPWFQKLCQALFISLSLLRYIG